VDAKLKDLEEKLIDPSRAKLVRDYERTITSLKRKFKALMDSWTDEPKKAVRQAIRDKIDQLGAQIEAHEKLREQYQEDAQRMEEARRHCQDLREHIRAQIDAGTATDEMKAKLAEANGLTVIVTKNPDGSRNVQSPAFDYARNLDSPFTGFLYHDSVGPKPIVNEGPGKAKLLRSDTPAGQTKDRWPVKPTPSAGSR
jgi:hypothetical protein